ncbi:MAG: exosortase system-associated protein, TIGR04073 family [Candidatus Omnitrophota bacterium]
MKNILKAGLASLIVLSIACLSYAAETSSSSTTNVTWGNKSTGTAVTSTAAKEKGPGMKAERGVKNILFGWTDIPKSIIQVTRDSKNPFWGLTGGTIKGIGKAFPRTVSGVADVVTFPLGDYNKVPVKPDELNTQIK